MFYTGNDGVIKRIRIHFEDSAGSASEAWWKRKMAEKD
jgi:hypothetical protein